MKRRIALVGNPNVGKSTIFNALTGLHQKTANWAGVTVSCACGTFFLGEQEFLVTDLPGIYSFRVRTEDEAAARDALLVSDFDDVLLICDATCLERGLHLLCQAAELLASRETPPRLILCVNLCDEAERKGIQVNFSELERILKIPVVPCRARERGGLLLLKEKLQSDEAYETLPPVFEPELVTAQAVSCTNTDYRKREAALDRFLTGPVTGTLFMLLLLMAVFWLTITGANYPSALLWEALFSLEQLLVDAAKALSAPDWFIGAFIYGVYRVTAWIISVMLPPMAIFFPLFTLLEDLGLLPRIAFHADSILYRCRACGKQCLTMCQSPDLDAEQILCHNLNHKKGGMSDVVTIRQSSCLLRPVYASFQGRRTRHGKRIHRNPEEAPSAVCP